MGIKETTCGICGNRHLWLTCPYCYPSRPPPPPKPTPDRIPTHRLLALNAPAFGEAISEEWT